jgi:hypothetical protein
MNLLDFSLPYIETSTLFFAVMAALGAALVTSAIVNVPDLRRIRLPFSSKTSLEVEAKRLQGEEGREGDSLLDRALAPLARDLMLRASPNERRWLEASLEKLGPTTLFRSVQGFYAAKVLLALGGFVAGAFLAVALTATGAPLIVLFVLPLTFAIPNYLAPKMLLKSMLDIRREQMVFEAPYVLNRLIVYLTLRGTVADALLNIAGATERGGDAMGGYLVRELRQTASDYLFWGSMTKALDAMVVRNDDVPIAQRIAERMSLHNQGTSSVDALHVIADRAQTTVENLIEKRGQQNSTLMIVPTIIALIGIVGAVVGPSLYSLMGFL